MHAMQILRFDHPICQRYPVRLYLASYHLDSVTPSLEAARRSVICIDGGASDHSALIRDPIEIAFLSPFRPLTG